MRVGIVGGSGYTGGELIRLLSTHPNVEIAWATSRKHAGKSISSVHPNLRSIGNLDEARFTDFSEDLVEKCDVVFLALPHGKSMDVVRQYFGKTRIIDMSADFRIKDHGLFSRYYGKHPYPELLGKSVYGLPELHRNEIMSSWLVANPGCIATSIILGLYPLIKNGLRPKAVIDAKIGSSASGRTSGLSNIHAERTGIVRPYAPADHRHMAEVEQELGLRDAAITCHAVGAVRGVFSTMHLFVDGVTTEKDLRKIYRDAYANEPFVRIVARKNPPYNLPDIKTVAYSNFVEIGFVLDERTGRIVVFSAIDNMIKGAAGQAVQNMNIMFGIEETSGLKSPGFYV